MSNLLDLIKVSNRFNVALGIACTLLGFLAIVSPFSAGIATSTLLAIAVITYGLTMCIYAFGEKSFARGALTFVAGLAAALVGVFIFFNPVLNISTLTLIAIIFFITDGAYGVYYAFQKRGHHGWGWILYSSVCSLALATL